MATGNWSNLVGAQVTYNTSSARQPGRRPSVQARVQGQDARYSCSECQIQYMMTAGSKAHCPLCEQREITQQVRDALFQVTNANNMLMNEHERLKSQVDTLTAMKMALEAISLDDLTFLKSVVYRWQSDRTKVALKPTHAAPRGRGKNRTSQINGFLALFRDGQAEDHLCNSVGGVAMACYLEEAVALVGQLKAMEILARAILHHLKASVDS